MALISPTVLMARNPAFHAGNRGFESPVGDQQHLCGVDVFLSERCPSVVAGALLSGVVPKLVKGRDC